jgi:hypothetical protein
LDTRAVIVLPEWPKFKEVTEDLKLIKQLPKEKNDFMRTTPTFTYETHDLISFAWVINLRFIDANTHTCVGTVDIYEVECPKA